MGFASLGLVVLAVVSTERRPAVRRVRGGSGSDFDYPIPPNPFAPASGGAGPKPPPPRPPGAAAPDFGFTLPGGEDEPASRAVAADHAAGAAAAAPPAPKGKGGLRFGPILCLGLIAAGCVLSRPAETGLFAALDAHHELYGGLIEPGMRDAEALVRQSPLGSAALHSDILWVGLLGAWMPLAPLSTAALRHYWPALGAAQLLAYSTLGGYLLRRVLPYSETFLAASLGNAKKGRIWTLVTAAFSPAGLVHWMHAAALMLLVVPTLEAQLGKWHTVAAFAAAGACASLASSLAQAPFAKSARGRASTSGALMGLIALRASLLPLAPVSVGAYEISIGRVLLLHFALELLSNPNPRPKGAERLAGLLGGTAVVGIHNPELWRELRSGEGWGRLADYVKKLL